MAKKKINTLRGKRLVTGDPNLITMNEIHVKDTSKGVEVTERDKNGKLVNVTMPTGGGEPVGGGSSASTKNQDKSVDITENGVTEVTADSGYTGLGKVTINANVQGGGSEGESNIEYIDVSGVDSEIAYMYGCYSNCVRWYSQGIEIGKEILQITPFSVGEPSRTEDYKIRDRIQAIAIDFNLKVLSSTTSGDTLFTVRKTLDLFGLTDILDTCPRITEEQFYTI